MSQGGDDPFFVLFFFLCVWFSTVVAFSPFYLLAILGPLTGLGVDSEV